MTSVMIAVTWAFVALMVGLIGLVLVYVGAVPAGKPRARSSIDMGRLSASWLAHSNRDD